VRRSRAYQGQNQNLKKEREREREMLWNLHFFKQNTLLLQDFVSKVPDKKVGLIVSCERGEGRSQGDTLGSGGKWNVNMMTILV
jgi:hypothetical protein